MNMVWIIFFVHVHVHGFVTLEEGRINDNNVLGQVTKNVQEVLLHNFALIQNFIKYSDTYIIFRSDLQNISPFD